MISCYVLEILGYSRRLRPFHQSMHHDQTRSAPAGRPRQIETADKADHPPQPQTTVETYEKSTSHTAKLGFLCVGGGLLLVVHGDRFGGMGVLANSKSIDCRRKEIMTVGSDQEQREEGQK